jgi:hypothetical protein
MKKKLIRLTESDLHNIIMETVKRVINEGRLPNHDNPVFIDCNSPRDADLKVEIAYSSYDSSLFYVGECGTDAYAAVEAICNYLVQNGIIENYTADELLVAENPEDYVDVNGYYFESSDIRIEQLVGNHRERRY